MNADVEKAAEGVRTALNDWAITHAPEFCADDSVAAARKRTSDEGTLAYIGDALASMDAITQALRDQEAEIARLSQESAQQFIRGREWAERYGRQFARAEKADALLREAVQWNWLEDGRPAVMEKLEARITAHLGAKQ